MSSIDSRREFLATSVRTAAATALLAPEWWQSSAIGQADSVPAAMSGVRELIASEAVFRPTTDGATIHWITSVALQTQVLAGPNPDQLALAYDDRCSGAAACVLSGHAADADLFFRCRFHSVDGGWIERPVQRIRTARRPGSAFRFAIIADSHQYLSGNAQRTENLRASIERVCADRPDFVIFAGDEAGVHSLSPNKVMSQAEADARWARWRSVYSRLLSKVPSFMVLGNHEGEAGYYQCYRERGADEYLQRWGTISRKRFCLNPSCDTYSHGGENEGWRGDSASKATGGADEGNRSPLENYFAWTWGDALIAVIDVHRYTNAGGRTPASPQQWTLGTAQLAWLERTLRGSRARWKFVVAHHVVGGSAWDLDGTRKDSEYCYGRGGARYSRIGEQARVTEMMRAHGAQFFLYGHDHVFAHQQADGLHYVCCGRPTFLQPGWWRSPGWVEAYGRVDARNPLDFCAAIGYTRIDVSPGEVTIAYIRTGTDEKRCENVDVAVGEVAYSTIVKPLLPDG